jgi:hypothetical protein
MALSAFLGPLWRRASRRRIFMWLQDTRLYGVRGISVSAVYDSSAATDLEYAINTQALLLATLATSEERRTAYEELCRLVKLRSPDRVREMEVEKGLAR